MKESDDQLETVLNLIDLERLLAWRLHEDAMDAYHKGDRDVARRFLDVRNRMRRATHD